LFRVALIRGPGATRDSGRRPLPASPRSEERTNDFASCGVPLQSDPGKSPTLFARVPHAGISAGLIYIKRLDLRYIYMRA